MSLAAEKLLAPSTSKDEILAYLKELKPALQKDGIIELGLFGSYANDYATISSDIDIVFNASDEFHKKFTSYDYFVYVADIRERLEKRFNLAVDIIDAKYIKDEKDKFFKGTVYV